VNCNQGDLAHIIFSLRPENIGRVVKVSEYIGKFSEREQFQLYGQVCQALVTDHYWIIEAEDLSIGLGPSPKAYIADSWLRPIRPEQEDISVKEEIEIEI
jgi:hypothetical protein